MKQPGDGQEWTRWSRKWADRIERTASTTAPRRRGETSETRSVRFKRA